MDKPSNTILIQLNLQGFSDFQNYYMTHNNYI